MEAGKALSDLQTARRGAQQGAQRQRTKSRACSIVTSAVQSVCVFLLEHTGTSRRAPATITGRPREEAPNALRICSKPTLYCTTNYVPYYQSGLSTSMRDIWIVITIFCNEIWCENYWSAIIIFAVRAALESNMTDIVKVM